MRKFTCLGLLCVTSMTLYGCDSSNPSTPPKETVETTTVEQTDSNFSDNILLSINNGAAGYGTIADITDATITIYTDGTIKVVMDTDEQPEIATLQMSEDDYSELTKIVNRKEISELMIITDSEVCDGSNYFIWLYDKNDEICVTKGGYMPINDDFWDIYDSIKEVLKPYEIENIVDEYREAM